MSGIYTSVLRDVELVLNIRWNEYNRNHG